MAIHGGLNEPEDEEQSRNKNDIETAFWETQNNTNKSTDMNADKRQKSNSENDDCDQTPSEDDDGSKYDGPPDKSHTKRRIFVWDLSGGGSGCIAGSSTDADDSTSAATNSTTTNCVNWSPVKDSLKESIGAFIVGCLPIFVDIVQHSAIFKRYQDLIILVLPLAWLISSFCNSLAAQFPSNDSIVPDFNQQPKPKFIEYWAPRFVLYYTGVIIIGTVVFFNRRGWNAEPMDSTIDLMLITWCAALCSFLLMGIAQVVVCLLSPYVLIIPVILSTQWWSTIWTELSTSVLSFIIEKLMENIGVQWRVWVAVVFLCFYALFGYCVFVTFTNKTAPSILKEAKWKPMLTTLLTQCIAGLLLYEAIRMFEDVEILYQISLTVNNYLMTYESNDLKTNLNEEDNTPSGQILPSCMKKGWWFATIVYALMLLINLIYILFFTTYRLNVKFLGTFCVISTLGLICRLFVTVYGIKILKERNKDLGSWIPYLNVLGDVMNMIGLRFMVLLYPSAEMTLFE